MRISWLPKILAAILTSEGFAVEKGVAEADVPQPDAAAAELRALSNLGGDARSDAIDALIRSPAFAILIDQPDGHRNYDGYWDAAYAWWSRRIGSRSQFSEFIECAAWLSKVNVDPNIALIWAARLAWLYRGFNSSVASIDIASGQPIHRLFISTLRCSMLRFLFKYRDLERATNQALEHWPLNAYFIALHSLALLGQNDARGDNQLTQLWERVKDATDQEAGLARRACIDALWAARPTKQRMELLRVYCTHTLERYRNDDRDYITYYRLSFAYRHLGDYGSASTAIGHALDRLRGDSVEFLNDQFLRERDLIATETRAAEIRNELLAVTATLEEAQGQATEAEHRLTQELSRQTIHLVEVLGLFSAIIAFVFGGFQMAPGADSVWRAILLILTTGIVSIAFLVVVMLVAQHLRPSK